MTIRCLEMSISGELAMFYRQLLSLADPGGGGHLGCHASKDQSETLKLPVPLPEIIQKNPPSAPMPMTPYGQCKVAH